MIGSVIAFYLPGGIPVYTYSLLIGLGAVLGLVVIARQSPETEALQRINAGVWACLGALIGGRLAYVLVSWPYFQTRMGESWQVGQGGLSAPGALAGGCLALMVYAFMTKAQAGVLADALLPLLGSLAVSAWLGCWLSGCAYGIPIRAWWAIPAVDEWGQSAPRLPVQFLGALLSLEIVWLMDWMRARLPRPGQASILAVLSLSLQMFAFSFLRVDPAQVWSGVRLEAWAGLGIAAVTSLLILYTLTLDESRTLQGGQS